MDKFSVEKTSRKVGPAKGTRSQYAGKAPDGVWILRSSANATHFTNREIFKAVRAVKSGRFAQKSTGAKPHVFAK